MFKQLKQLLDISGNDPRADKPVGEMDRLRRACAQQVVDRERRAPSRPDQPLQVSRLPGVSHDTKLDLEQTPHVAAEVSPRAPANDTRLDLPKTPSVAAEVPAAPSVLQRLRNWVRGPASPRADRRGAPRHPFARAHPQLRVLVGPCKWPAQVTDVSATGIGLILGLRHRLGSDLQLTVQDRSRASSFPIEAKVKRLVLRPDGQWLVCCAFDRPLDEQGLKALR